MSTQRPTPLLALVYSTCLCFIGESSLHAAVTTATRTQDQLHQVEHKMGELRHTLTDAETTRRGLYQALASAEKQMGEHIHTLHTLNADIEKKQQAIAGIEQAVAQGQSQLKTQQQALARHLRARYEMGDIQPLQWLFNQDSPEAVSRMLTYYQYVLRADQRLIQHVRETTATLSHNQNTLRQEFTSLQQLQLTLLDRQKKLTQAKVQQQAVIQSLSQSIQTKQQALADYQRDHAHLQALLEQLSRPLPARLPSAKTPSTVVRLNARFTYPLKSNPGRAQSLNQGMVFFAPQGSAVSAVLPGKVVFSDWLNGYGLLLIIDHGQGMMSLYAHNESLFKSKGAAVQQGEQIATVGHTGGLRENGLYFELRRRGKVIPPRQWLS